MRLALPAAAAWLTLAIVIGTRGAATPSAVASGALAVVGILLAIALRAQRRRLTAAASVRVVRVVAVGSVCAALTTLLLASAAAGEPQRHPDALDSAAQDGGMIVADVVLDESPSPARSASTAVSPDARSGTAAGAPRLRIIGHLTALHVRRDGTGSAADATLRTATPVPVVVFALSGADGDTASPRVGATVRVTAAVRATDPADHAAYLLLARGSVQQVADPGGPLAVAAELRAALTGAASRLPGPGAELLPGLAIGDTSRVSADLAQRMKDSSLTHLTAVSGANCAVVVGLVLALGALVGLRRPGRAVIALVALGAFVILVTPQPSVLRAAVMAAVLIASSASGQPSRGVPALALAVVVLLTHDPWLARDLGFVLSVLATAGLLVLAPPLADRLARHVPRRVADAVSIPVAAQIACQPVLLGLQPGLPVHGVLANLLAEPAAAPATIGGLVACVLLPVWPWAGSVALHLAWLPAAWIAAVAQVTAELPVPRIPWLTGTVGALALIVVTVLVLVLVSVGRDPRRRRIAVGSAAALCLVAGAVAGGVAGPEVIHRVALPGDWQMGACDVGQGDGIVLRSRGQVALIDTGRYPDKEARCLTLLGITHVDLLVLTHYDADHVGAARSIAGMVATALVGPTGRDSDTQLVAALQTAGVEIRHGFRGMTGSLGDLDWRILWPPEDPARRIAGGESGNDASVTLLVTGHPGCGEACLSGLFLGDLGEEGQDAVMAAAPLPHVDVVKMAHHGSADQSEALYRAVDASVALVSVGADNDYGHPTAHALDLLAEARTQPLRTDRMGTILLAPGASGDGQRDDDGSQVSGARRIRVWSERTDDGEPPGAPPTAPPATPPGRAPSMHRRRPPAAR